MERENLVTEEIKKDFVRILEKIQANHPDQKLVHGMFFVFGIDELGQPTQQREILTSFGEKFEDMRMAIKMMAELVEILESPSDKVLN